MAWKVLIIAMFGLIAVISGIFGAGFTLGYATRDLISRRRRQWFVQRRDLDDTADYPSFIPDSADFDFKADPSLVPVGARPRTSGRPADAQQHDKLKPN